jgi:hypothetical protein
MTNKNLWVIWALWQCIAHEYFRTSSTQNNPTNDCVGFLVGLRVCCMKPSHEEKRPGKKELGCSALTWSKRVVWPVVRSPQIDPDSESSAFSQEEKWFTSACETTYSHSQLSCKATEGFRERKETQGQRPTNIVTWALLWLMLDTKGKPRTCYDWRFGNLEASWASSFYWFWEPIIL